MPRFDTEGRLISGTGSGIVAVNGVPISPGGVANWLASGQAIFQSATDDRLYLWEVFTPEKPPVLLPGMNQGANALAAGGGRWIAWLAGTGLYNSGGVIDASGRLAGVSMEQDGRGAASPEGHIAVTDNENQGFRIIGPNGEVTREVRGTIALSMHVLDGNTAVWVDERNQPRAIGLPQPAIPREPIYAIRVVEVGELFVLAGTGNGLILYPWNDATKGWRLTGNAFYPTAFVRNVYVVSIAYAAGAGETPDSLRVWDVNVLSDEKVPLYPDVPPLPTPEPEPEPPPMSDIPDQTAVVARIRGNFPTPLGATHGRCLMDIARAIGKGAGLLLKDGGTHVVLPDGTKVAQDIICFPDGRIFDCLGDGENAATPGWSEAHGSPVDPKRYYGVSGSQPPVPQPPASDVHPYDGGENDTGHCDYILRNGNTCNLPPSAAVHQVPPKPDPGPDPVPDSALGMLRQIMADVSALRRHLGVPD